METNEEVKPLKLELHCHTTCSDGRLTPEELYQLAKKENLAYMALTDHDSVDGHFRMEKSLEEDAFHYIPGIELTTSQNGESIHILGYFNSDSYKDPAFLKVLRDLHEARNERIRKFITNLKTHFDLTVDYDHMRKSNQGVLTRANLAREVQPLVPHLSYNEAFETYLDKKSPAYVPNIKLTVEDGISLLKKYGAKVVLAHPVIYKKNTLEDLLNHDFDGLECYYFLNDDGLTEKSLRLAKEKNLLITVGSDYHGIPGDMKHGYLGSMSFKEEDLSPFISWFQEGPLYRK